MAEYMTTDSCGTRHGDLVADIAVQVHLQRCHQCPAHTVVTYLMMQCFPVFSLNHIRGNAFYDLSHPPHFFINLTNKIVITMAVRSIPNTPTPFPLHTLYQ
jgi:hypothetical protein